MILLMKKTSKVSGDEEGWSGCDGAYLYGLISASDAQGEDGEG